MGKLRKDYMPATIGENGMTVLRALKQTMDPENIFNNGNLGLNGNSSSSSSSH